VKSENEKASPPTPLQKARGVDREDNNPFKSLIKPQLSIKDKEQGTT